MAIRWSTKFFTGRVKAFELEARGILTEDAEREYTKAATEVAEWWSKGIRSSGRGGASWNSQMADVKGKATQPRSGGFFVRVGWIDGSPPRAADGSATWFVYQDSGYRFFGGPHWVQGLGLQIQARSKLGDAIHDANKKLADKVKRAARKVR